MDVLGELTTPWEECPYLHDRPYRLKVRVVGTLTGPEYERELERGGRRFGSVLFEPACNSCRECVPIRLLVGEFRASKSQRRVLRRNRDVEVTIGQPHVNDERLDLYLRFHEERRRRKGWPAPTIDEVEYFTTLVDNPVRTLEFRYRVGRRLVGLAYVGEATRAFNSIYAFHDPELSKRSLGTFDILTEIDAARRRGKKHLYLGFTVAGCSSMEYKRTFLPHELRIDGEWVRFNRRDG